MRKSITMWLRRLPDDIREKAMTNYRNGDVARSSIDKKVESLSRAINLAFIWIYTPEGDNFWRKIHEELENKEFEARKFKIISTSTTDGILSYIQSSGTTYTYSTNPDYTWRIENRGTITND